MFARGLDAWLEDLTRRWGPHYLSRLRALVLVLLLVVVNLLVTTLLWTHMHPSPDEFVRIMLVGNAGIVLVVTTWLLPRWRRISAPFQALLEGGDPPDAVEAWRCAQTFTRDHLVSGVQAGIVAIVVAIGYGAWELDLSLLDVAIGTFAELIVVLFIVVIAWPVVDLAQRPLRRRLVRALPTTVLIHRPEASIRVRATLSIMAVSAVTGAGVAVVATVDDSIEAFGALLVVATALTATFGGVLAVVWSRSLLAPLDDVLDTARSVAAGQLDQRVEVTSSDEIGEVAVAFNEMLDVVAQSAAEVRASRERIVAASDAERRRIERNIHDGAQQQMVAVALQLRALQARVADDPEAAETLAAAVDSLQTALDELRELAQGLHPSILSSDGLGAALELLSERATVPVTVAADGRRWPEMIESTAWFVVSEALANVGKYAQASSASVSAQQQDGQLVVEVVDDGVGGAHLDKGSGLRGLADRVEAVGGTLAVDSPAGGGTTLIARLPVAEATS